MPNEWSFIGLFLLMAGIFPATPILLQVLLGPKKSNPVKSSTYECGIETVGETWVQFKVQYYVFALVFVVFSVEVVFLFPFAVAFGQVGLFGVLAVIIFFVLIAASLVYDWLKGWLEWV